MDLVFNTLYIYPFTGGMKTFLINLVSSLLQVDSNNRYHLLCSSLNVSIFNELTFLYPSLSIHLLSLSSENTLQRIFYDQFIVPQFLKDNFKAPILVTTSNIVSFFCSCPQIVVVQSPLAIKTVREDCPQFSLTAAIGQLAYFDFLMKPSIEKADKVITVSNYIKQKMIASYPIASNKITSIYEGIDSKLFQLPVSPKSTTESISVEPYILFVSTLYPYKRADQLLYAYAKAIEKQPSLRSFALVFAGYDPDQQQIPSLKQKAQELGVLDRISFLGLIPHEKVASLYQNASVFVYPSMMETFGLPILEAMSCGVPVIASNRMSIPEVAGGAAILIDPDDLESFSEALLKVLTQEELRKDLVAKGLRRASEMSWENTARQFLAELTAIGSLGS